MINIEKGAHISECSQYRYMLWRMWDDKRPRQVWIMLNPSTADAETDDPTILELAPGLLTAQSQWGYGKIMDEIERRLTLREFTKFLTRVDAL